MTKNGPSSSAGVSTFYANPETNRVEELVKSSDGKSTWYPINEGKRGEPLSVWDNGRKIGGTHRYDETTNTWTPDMGDGDLGNVPPSGDDSGSSGSGDY